MDRLSKTKAEISSKPLDTREIVYTSLLLLGFVPREMEDKYNIPFTRDMFSLPNKKGFEVVMYFLFERLNPTLSQERFRHCWPIMDKKQEQTFRKTISSWLSEISKEDEDANLPRIVPSLFMSPGGDKFYTLLFYFCSYVMVKTCKNEHGVKSRDLLRGCIITANTKQYAPVMAQTIQASTVTPRKKFLHATQELVILQRQWKTYAGDLVKEYRSLCKKIRELQHAIREEESKMIANAGSTVGPGIKLRVRPTGMTDGEWDVLTVKRAQRIQKVRDLWQSVKVCCQDQAEERAVVDSITSERAKKDRLDAADLPVQVPEILLRECEQEIQKRRINNIYEGGKLDLCSLIKLWNLSLRLYLEKLNEAPVPDFEEMLPSVATQVHTQNAHLANARALRNSLAEEVLPDLQRSVSQLLKYKETGVELPTRDSLVKASPRHFLGKGVGLLPPTPPVSFDPAASSDATPLKKASSLFKKSPESVETPEVMTQIRDSVHERALRKAGLAQGTPSSTLREIRVPTQSEQNVPTTGKDFPRQRYKSATSNQERNLLETPLSTKSRGSRKDGTFRHPSSKRMVQTTVKKKKKPSFQRTAETAREKQHVKNGHETGDVGNLENAMKGMSVGPKGQSSSVDRAHNKLIEQIVESVVSSASSGRSSPTLTPDSVSGGNSKSPSSLLAIEDPLGSLGLDAFTSRDKIRHSPLEKVESLTSDKEQPEQFESLESYDGSSRDDHTLVLPPSQNANHQMHDEDDDTHTNNEPPKVDTAMLIDLGNGSLPSSSLVDTKSRNRSEQNPDFAAWNVTLQKSSHSAKSPASQMLDRFEVETSAGVNRDLEGAIVVEDLLQFMETDRPEGTILSDVEEKGLKSQDPSNSGDSKEMELSDNCEKTEASPLSPENVSLRDLHEPPSPFHVLESPEVGIHLSSVSDKGDISSVHLDEELSDIFQTRTPQLPDRLRRKIEAEGESPQPPSNGSVSMHDSSLHLRTISGSSSTHEQFGLIPEVRKLDMTSSLEEDSSVTSGLDRSMAVDRLNRTKSGSSQKSVTFSEAINQAVESISEETMPVMEDDWHTSPAHDKISPLTTDSPQREDSMQRSESGILGEEYLVSSPKPPLNQSSHIDDAFSIDLESPDGGEVFSMNRPIEDLLEHISPMISPSSTPQIPIGVRVSRKADQSLISPDVTPELPLISRPVTTVGAADTTPAIKQSSSERLHLSQKMASLRMTAGSVGVNGSPGHLYSKDSSEFNLLEEDESLLVPTSPVQ